RIHQLARGVPRRINLLCDRALLGAYASGQSGVNLPIVEKAASEVFGAVPPAQASRQRRIAWAAGIGLAAAASLAGAVAYGLSGSSRTPVLEARPAQKAVPAAPATSIAAVGKAAGRPASGAAHTASSASAPTLDLAPSELAGRFDSPLLTEGDAWRELALAWKVAPAGGEPCQAMQREQVQCWRMASSNLALIRQLDRPGIVTLHGLAPKPVYALLTGLSDRSATLRMGNRSQTISLPALAAVWRGDFATLWRTPAAYNKPVDGSAGPMTDWLADRLTAAHVGGADDAGALKSRIVAFQLAQGLRADGLAGPTTLMQLNRATGLDEPRLRTD
ncbi:MAG TPA: peptidoglycan-binding protein, partial [Albitalea sp.]|nr:peptidoglycan-binding protein [Albitalea sp.]